MEKRKLGNPELMVAPIVFGGNVFGWTVDEKTSFALLDAFVDAGFNCIDTANSYSRWVPGNKGGESETIIGKWMKERGNRDGMIVATKVGSDMGLGRKCLQKNHILEEVEKSLARLQTDYIDLYQSHYDDLSTPVSETLEAYNELVEQGKVRVIGTSNMSAERIKESIEYGRKNSLPVYQTLQPEYNLYDREKYEENYEALCLKENLSVITYYSLASGFLTGKYRSENDLSKSKRGSAVQKYLDERGYEILNALDKLSAQYQTTPAVISLAWLMHRPGITAPIASATSVEQLREIMKAAEIKLDNDSIAILDKASEY